MTVETRPAHDADLPFLWRLHRNTMRAYVEQTWGWDEADQRRRFHASVGLSGRRVVLVDGVPAGVVAVERRPDGLLLAAIEVAPECQRRGVGSRVVRAVIAEANGRPVTLRVLRVNPARVLYERLGFAVTAETETHYEMTCPPAHATAIHPSEAGPSASRPSGA